MASNKIASIFLISILITGLTGIAFADSGENGSSNNNHVNQSGQDLPNNQIHSGNQSEDNIQSNQENNQTLSENQMTNENQNQTEYQSEHNNLQFDQESNQTLSENQMTNENNQNKTEGENYTQANQEGIDEINNENNNEEATHQENQQDANNIENAVENKTVAAEVNIGPGNEETKSIDSNIDVHTDNSTGDTVSVTVDSKTESGPKVIIFNLNSTTIDVANVKYLHVTYDGHSIQPATDVNAVLHPKSTDNPSYAIIVTQNGAQILVSIPHFSTHTITLSNISKVITPVPEFPIALLVLIAAMIPIVIVRKISIWNKHQINCLNHYTQ